MEDLTFSRVLVPVAGTSESNIALPAAARLMTRVAKDLAQVAPDIASHIVQGAAERSSADCPVLLLDRANQE